MKNYWINKEKSNKEKLEFHLEIAAEFKNIAIEDYKRGLLQAALSFGVISHDEWIQYLKKYCPIYAQ
jgi:CO dehydrogenase/acetyl-CoA synthase epsilon subunit